MKWAYGMAVGIGLFLKGSGQSFHNPVKSVDLNGGAYSSRFINAFSFGSNPAVLGSAKFFQAGLSGENQWLLKELAFYRIAVSFPAGQGGIGLIFHYTGDTYYNESALGLGYGKNLGRVELGLQFRCDFYYAAGYTRYPFGSALAGLRFHPSEKIAVGLAIRLAVFGGAGGGNPEKGASGYQMGIGYELSAQVLLALQWIKETGQPVNIKGSIDYRFSDQFFAAFGVEGLTASPRIKSGWKKNGLSVEIFTAYNPILGFSPGILLLWCGKKKSG